VTPFLGLERDQNLRPDSSVEKLAKLLAERGSGRGLISICAAGGLGVTAIMEVPTHE
jgi:hypothetical protein